MSNLKPSTLDLINSFVLDIMPKLITMIDFGIDENQNAFAALQWTWKRGLVSDSDLDKALGDGPQLTKIVNSNPKNPYKCTIVTAWDEFADEQDE